jgi:hypothetical protein
LAAQERGDYNLGRHFQFWGLAMESNSNDMNTPDRKQAVEHLGEVQTLLKDLRDELNQHPKLEDAIQRLEMALSLLTTKSGGLL